MVKDIHRIEKLMKFEKKFFELDEKRVFPPVCFSLCVYHFARKIAKAVEEYKITHIKKTIIFSIQKYIPT